MRIAVTGGSGKLGKATLIDLRSAGHEVINFDRVADREGVSTIVDFTDYGQTLDAILGVNDRHTGLDAIVHLAAIPAPGILPDAATFQNNMLSTFHVFQSARRAGISRIVYASSETVLGLPFDAAPPYLPVDEEYDTRPESVYSLVKHLEEEMARKFVRWEPELSITALRFSNVMAPQDYAAFADFQDDASLRKWNLWGYIDARDGAQAIRRALETAKPGFEAYIVAAADTVMTRPNDELVAELFPEVNRTTDLGVNDTLLSIAKARRDLGYEPQHSWRDAR